MTIREIGRRDPTAGRWRAVPGGARSSALWLIVVAAREHDVDRGRLLAAERWKRDPVAMPDVLGAELLGVEHGPRVAVLVHHAVAAAVLGAGPEHLCVAPPRIRCSIADV